ncbi:MAG: NAD+ synthase [Candidatus Daviesbacteria bacterium]|nr:NAD+ synthase [Candidatus Daviesbacteria bacterium]
MFKENSNLAIAQISSYPGEISDNVKKIINSIIKAKSIGAKLIIFPELAIPGYMSLDLMLYPKYIEENLKALDKIKLLTKDVMAIIGFIDQDRNKIGPDGTAIRYNSAAIIYDQKIVAIQDKTLLPNYDVFFEKRYFAEGRDRKIINFQDLKLGIEICEDLWDENYSVKVSQDLIKKGADILINISSSPFYLGKRNDRENLIKRISLKFKVPFVYVNCVGVQDGYDGELVFDGQSMVFNNKGELIRLGKEFEDDIFYINPADLWNGKRLTPPRYNQIHDLYKALVLAITSYFRRTKFRKAYIGLSGGIDSAVVASLAVKALGSKNVTGILMPSQFTDKESINDAKKLAKNLTIEYKIIFINGLFKNFQKSLKNSFKEKGVDTTEENLQARIRGMILMAHANKFKGLVISTANKTETALGYTTLYGDMCGAIAPLADVSKLLVYELANFINQEQEIGIIPQNIIKRIPTAELRVNQTDEQSLGAPYSIISPLVDEIIEGGKGSKELEKKYSKKVVEHITNLINQNEYKRRQAAPAVKVTKKAFGIGRRIPIVHQFKI